MARHRNDVNWRLVAKQYRAGRSSERIATEHGVSRNAVINRLRMMGEKIRKAGVPYRRSLTSTRRQDVQWTEAELVKRRAYFRQKQREHRARVAADPVRRARQLRYDRMRHAARRQEG